MMRGPRRLLGTGNRYGVTLFLALAAAAFLGPRPAAAAPVTVVTSADTSEPNSVKTVEVPGLGYYVFYNNGGVFEWAFSPDGVNWTNSGNTIFNAANSVGDQGSVWFDAASSSVFVAAPSALANNTTNGSDSLWYQKGTINMTDGSLTWLSSDGSYAYNNRTCGGTNSHWYTGTPASIALDPFVSPTVVFVTG